MQVKTFTGATSQEVLARVKAEMGPEAVILGNRTYRKNGVVQHELTVGLEWQALGEAASDAPSGWGEWHKEWMRIKDQLFALMKPAIQLERLTPRQRVALEYLQREGVSDAVAVDLYKRLLAEPGASVLECLYGMVPVKAWGPAQWGQRVHLLVGPFGFGKTTTALRFALHLRKSEPEARIAFINADCLRGNGRLTLRHWAELSNFTYLEAPDKAGMERALTSVKDARAVFVDVPGLARGQNLAQWRTEMGLDLPDMKETATHLVLSPFCSALQTQEFLQRYQSRGPCSLVWTKLDEAASFGSIVNVACAAGLPVSALSFGAELKESLAPATEPLIWRLIFKRQIPGQAA
ncbi:flagellar biosynthesis protein FlhF [uncultured Desulfovibrio sp.]|uniref:flagellar biosynthesis protein FlhF n=1 Tax=uncultured Desulfovibrio sp. TaxID=167968 RepID=UPI002634A500|nr:flagellar biosynthesis protein FlhF [uncultured Desulfovibrio sp.]